MQEFYNSTKCPVLINTSFNIRGEPIVFSPYDSLKCFMNTEMDILAIGPYILEKSAQPDILSDKDFKNKFELD